MKLIKKHTSFFLLLLFLGVVVGTLGWEVVERIVASAGGSLRLQAGPISLDLGAIYISIRANPGTLAGICLGFILFLRL